MPGPEDLTQRLLWLGATQSLCARAEESGASAEIVELHQNDLSLDSLCHPPKPEFGCSRKRVHRQMRLSGIASVRRWAYKVTTNSRHSHPVASNLLFFEQPNQAWGRYYLHSHRRGLALSGHRQGLVYRQKGGLCLFQSY